MCFIKAVMIPSALSWWNQLKWNRLHSRSSLCLFTGQFACRLRDLNERAEDTNSRTKERDQEFTIWLPKRGEEECCGEEQRMGKRCWGQVRARSSSCLSGLVVFQSPVQLAAHYTLLLTFSYLTSLPAPSQANSLCLCLCLSFSLLHLIYLPSTHTLTR